VVSLFARSEPMQFVFVGHVNGNVYSNNPCTKESGRKHLECSFSVSPAEHLHAMNYVFLLCDVCASHRRPLAAPSLNMVSKCLILTATDCTELSLHLL
jgi:hypothetical protein